MKSSVASICVEMASWSLWKFSTIIYLYMQCIDFDELLMLLVSGFLFPSILRIGDSLLSSIDRLMDTSHIEIYFS